MRRILRLSAYGISTTLALFLSCLGVEIIEENALGWALLVVGVGYPAGIILYEMKGKEGERLGNE